MLDSAAVVAPKVAVASPSDSAVAAAPAAAPPAPKARRPPPPAGQSKRQEFLSGLLNEDLQKLSTWHHERPQHEQKRFVRTVDALYKEFSKAAGASAMAPGRAAPPPRQRQGQALASVFEDDELHSSTPREQTRLLGASASEPSLPSKPIEVFEQRRRAGASKRAKGCNTLEAWMDGASASSVFSATTASTRVSGRSQVTLTTSSGASSVGGPITTNQSSYKRPKHLHLLSNVRMQRGCGCLGSDELKDGLADCGFPEKERFRTIFSDEFGRAPLADNVPPEACNKVVRDSQLPFVKSFLEGAAPEQRAQFGNAVRSLQSLRRMGKGNRTTAKDEFDQEENSRLWVPSKTEKPPSGMATFSRVPLGGASLSAAALKGSGLSKQLPALDKVSASLGRPPPSPSVSNLSSVMLSPAGSDRAG